MKKVICSTYDAAINCFSGVFIMRNAEEAKQAYIVAVSDPKTPLRDRPNDFVLMHVGYFDDDTGVVENVTSREVISAAGALAILRARQSVQNGDAVFSESVNYGVTQL